MMLLRLSSSGKRKRYAAGQHLTKSVFEKNKKRVVAFATQKVNSPCL